MKALRYSCGARMRKLLTIAQHRTHSQLPTRRETLLADRQPIEHELLLIAEGLLTELGEWLTAQLLSAPERDPSPSDYIDHGQFHEAMQRRRESGAGRHFAERQQDYILRFGGRMVQLYDGLVVRGVHPDVTRPKYAAGGHHLITDMVIRDLELVVLRLEARLGRK